MKKFTTIAIIIFILALLGIGYFYLTNNQSGPVDSGNVFDNVKNFFPFGKTNNTQTQTGQPTSTTNQPQQNQTTDQKPVEKIFQISDAPVAGYISLEVVSTSTKSSDLFGTSTASTTATSTKTKNKTSKPIVASTTDTYVRFIERAIGHIFDVKIPTIEKSRVSNTTIPKIYNAVFSPKGDEFITQFLNGDSVTTMYNKIATSTASTTIMSIPYPFNTDIVISLKDKIFYTTRSSAGSLGFLSTFDRKKPTQVFSTPLRDILATPSNTDIVAIFPKAHSDYSGVLTFVNTKKITFSQVGSAIKGLTALPNSDATYFLYNTDPKNLSLAGENVSNQKDTLFQNKTLPEKCVWSKKNIKIVYCAVPLDTTTDGGYPEKWYQGVVSFNDVLWSLNVETGEEKLLFNPLTAGKQPADMTNLSLSDKENYLFYINKKDLTLWGISLNSL